MSGMNGRNGLLTLPRTLGLKDGYALRLLSAREALEADRAGEVLAQEDRERALCANACLLAAALIRKGEPVFDSGEAVLEAMTAGQIADLSARWAQFDRSCNPSVLDGEEAVEAAKKVWSTRLMSAFNGVCSVCLGRFPRRNGRSK